MTVEAAAETRGFETEAKQLLKLMIHSLYSNKEIFLRELISNASDAADKLRFESLKNDSLFEGDSELKIRIEFDKENNTVTVNDNGIGMNRDEVVANLGTIAKSGTADFLANLSGDEKKDSQLIGQFGVGFYSAFIVADRVTVETRRAGDTADQATRWSSSGEAEYTLENIEKDQRGTTITLHLKKDQEEFADGWRLRNIVKKYSDHISLPVVMQKQDQGQEMHADDAKDEDESPSAENKASEENKAPDENKAPEYETINTATALWTRARNDVSEEEYKEFYKHISHDYSDPMTWSHNKVEGKLEYNSLLFLPEKAPFDLYNRDAPKGLKLYVQRTFIMDEAQQFLPLYLRFIKGVVDSNDLSLNVSREILQKDPHVDSMRTALTKRVLDMLDKLAKKEPEKYATFWKEFGEVIKEGPAEDFANKEKIAKLMRFTSTHTGAVDQNQSLDDYIGRMKDGQDKIYYIVAENHQTAQHSPHLEVFRKKEIEVLLLSDRVDDWLMGHLMDYDGKTFQDVGKGELDLGKMDTEEDKKQQEKVEKEFKDFTKRVKDALGEDVDEVRVTHRLTDSPACLVVGEHDMGGQMRRLLESAGQKVPDTKPSIEINPEHPLIEKMDQEADEDRFSDLAKLVFDQANLAEGGTLKDPGAYVGRINKLLVGLIQ